MPKTALRTLTLSSVLVGVAFAAPSVSAGELSAQQSAAVERMEQLLTANPAVGGVMFGLATVYASAGQAEEAVRWLRKALDTGIAVEVVGNSAFESIRRTKAFQDILPRAVASAVPLVASTLAFRTDEKDLGPEGIAYDPQDRCFYLGSMTKRKIVRVGADGVQSDFTTAGQDGLLGVLGLRVDRARRHLWANAFAPDGSADAGASGLFQYDLGSGRLLRKFVVGSSSDKHLFNDLVVTADGGVFLTDSERGYIYRLPPEGGSLEVFIGAGGEYRYLNGITLDASGRRLYISDFLHGISLLDIATRRIIPVGHAVNISTLGIDGLYLFENSLIAIQNADGMERILRFKLDKAGTRISAMRALERGNSQYETPMTGAIAGHDLYFVANGKPSGQAPRETVVHRLPLR
jgi:hypothetical protein